MRNNKVEYYTVGIDEIPVWLRYKLKRKVKPDGEIVYEYFSAQRFELLKAGDVIIKDRDRIKIKREGRK